MESTKELTLKDMMQFAHDLEEMQESLDMINGFLGDSKIRTIKKEWIQSRIKTWIKICFYLHKRDDLGEILLENSTP